MIEPSAVGTKAPSTQARGTPVREAAKAVSPEITKTAITGKCFIGYSPCSSGEQIRSGVKAR
jgi:hypothetical protein